jgi:hypothetical protein
LAVSAVFLSFAGSACTQDAAWVPDSQAINELESVVQLPDWGRSTAFPNGHKPDVAEYARFYAGSVSNGRHMILAEFVHVPGYAGVHMVPTARDFPVIMDGGCHIINIRYDADAKRIEKFTCNGMA